MKMLIDEGSDRILGFTAFGAEASELMATVQTAMLGNLPYTALRDALFTHPTAAEGLTLLLANVMPAIELDAARTRQATNVAAEESEIDQILADSFPASDAPPWTLGVTRRHPRTARRRRRHGG